jgi:hypothetical protein
MGSHKNTKITGMYPKTSFGNTPQQAAGYYTLRFAGLRSPPTGGFNLPIPKAQRIGIGVSRISFLTVRNYCSLQSLTYLPQQLSFILPCRVRQSKFRNNPLGNPRCRQCP